MNGSTQTIATANPVSRVSDQAVSTSPSLGFYRLAIPDLMILEPMTFADERGLFMETFNERVLSGIGIAKHFVQDNVSISKKGVLRGLHYQVRQPQGKLIRVVVGEIFDVAVDIRANSIWFGKHVGVRLSASVHRLFWIPEGFAHGFVVLSDSAQVLYKATDYYAPLYERTILWNDPELGINWPLASSEVIVSEKDRNGLLLRNSECFA